MQCISSISAGTRSRPTSSPPPRRATSPPPPRRPRLVRRATQTHLPRPPPLAPQGPRPVHLLHAQPTRRRAAACWARRLPPPPRRPTLVRRAPATQTQLPRPPPLAPHATPPPTCRVRSRRGAGRQRAGRAARRDVRGDRRLGRLVRLRPGHGARRQPQLPLERAERSARARIPCMQAPRTHASPPHATDPPPLSFVQLLGHLNSVVQAHSVSDGQVGKAIHELFGQVAKLSTDSKGAPRHCPALHGAVLTCDPCSPVAQRASRSSPTC